MNNETQDIVSLLYMVADVRRINNKYLTGENNVK